MTSEQMETLRELRAVGSLRVVKAIDAAISELEQAGRMRALAEGLLEHHDEACAAMGTPNCPIADHARAALAPTGSAVVCDDPGHDHAPGELLRFLNPTPAPEAGPQPEEPVHGDNCVDDCEGCDCWCHAGELLPPAEPASTPAQRTEKQAVTGVLESVQHQPAEPAPAQGELKCAKCGAAGSALVADPRCQAPAQEITPLLGGVSTAGKWKDGTATRQAPAQGEAEGAPLEVCLAAMVKQRDQLLGKMMQLQARLAAKDEEIARWHGAFDWARDHWHAASKRERAAEARANAALEASREMDPEMPPEQIDATIPAPEAGPPYPPAEDEKRGLYGKYEVIRTDGSSGRGRKHEHCYYFVLDTDHDPFSRPALLAYADACELSYPFLAKDLRDLAATVPPPTPAPEAEPQPEPLTAAELLGPRKPPQFSERVDHLLTHPAEPAPAQGEADCSDEALAAWEGVHAPQDEPDEKTAGEMLKQALQWLGECGKDKRELQARLAAKDEEIERLRAQLKLEESNGDAIMSLRADLEEQFGPEVRAAFLDDQVHNAIVLATRAAEARASAAEAERDALLNGQKPLFDGARSRVLKRLGVPDIDAALVKIDSTESRLAAAEEALRKLRDAIDRQASSAAQLEHAINCDDPKRELLFRTTEILRELAALAQPIVREERAKLAQGKEQP